MPAFFSAAYLGSAMSSNLFRGEKKHDVDVQR